MLTLIRSATFTGYASLATRLGVNVPALLAEGGINPACLDDLDLLINADAVAWVYEETARRSGTPDFGLRLAETRSFEHLGVLAIVLRGEPSLRAVLETITRYLKLHSEGLALTFEETDDDVILRIDFITGATRGIRQSTELTVAVFVRCFRVLMGPTWHPRLACFIHDRPESVTTHRRVLGCDLSFGAEFTGLLLALADLDRPIHPATPEPTGQIRRLLDDLLAGAGPDFPAKVRRLVHMLLPMGRCTVERVADHLSMDRRTVHRHLATAGTTFSALVDEARGELALRFLGAGARPLSEVADLLGFAAQSGLSRWFVARFGMTPTSWRRQELRPRD